MKPRENAPTKETMNLKSGTAIAIMTLTAGTNVLSAVKFNHATHPLLATRGRELGNDPEATGSSISLLLSARFSAWHHAVTYCVLDASNCWKHFQRQRKEDGYAYARFDRICDMASRKVQKMF